MKMLTLTPDFTSDFMADFDRVVNSFLRPTYSRGMAGPSSTTPYRVDEKENHYLLSLDMPGVKKEDIEMSVEENQLFIHAVRRQSDRKYERQFSLPSTVNVEQIQAHYEDGVLSIALPKAETAKRRTISVQSGSALALGQH